MSTLTRRQFLRWLTAMAVLPAFKQPFPQLGQPVSPAVPMVDIYIARNGTPEINVQQALALAGGIQHFIDKDDVVVLKPNGQWPNQGYTNTESMKALIHAILNRPGGFTGEIIITEHVHRSPAEALNGSYCWNMSVGNRVNNWPDMAYFELVADYHCRGIPIVTANPMYDSGTDTWVLTTGPAGIAAGKQGWVRSTYTTAANGRTIQLTCPILRSSYSGKLIDLKNGVWQNGSYTGQKVKTIFLPTLNNHGSFNSEDYAGPTSALKCHIGFQDFNVSSGTVTIHSVGYDAPISPRAMGESVGALITQVVHPAFYMTCAEYTGYRDRTNTTAAHTRTIGLCSDPVTLDYWMCKYNRTLYHTINRDRVNTKNINYYPASELTQAVKKNYCANIMEIRAIYHSPRVGERM